MLVNLLFLLQSMFIPTIVMMHVFGGLTRGYVFNQIFFFSGEHLNFIAQGQRPKKSFYNALAALTVASQRFLHLWKIPTPTVLAVVCTLVLNRVLTIAQLKKQLRNCFSTGCSVLCLQGLDANHLSIHCLLLP